ncbi:uncharacterized protein L201_003003 [Kwoniella dendrophila CBS 6074]|uniref:GRIP domain-containing protein n=1 Tax=Kwoniella dendrophila CBS 6074 TaxID=1295534 RepID=A0AAX4JT80_9TREE
MSDSGAAAINTNGDNQAGPSSNPTSPQPDPSSPEVNQNGTHEEVDPPEVLDPQERIRQLEQELASTRQDNDKLSNQYRGLLGKLTAMRTTLGDKLKEDAEELDRRENSINNLTNENTQLQETLQRLEIELNNVNEESSSLVIQLNQLKLQTNNSSSDVLNLTKEMRELRGEFEKLRIEKEEIELDFNQEKSKKEFLEDELSNFERNQISIKNQLESLKIKLDKENQRSENLQDVLEEFQIAKDSELRQATEELETQLRLAATSLSEYKLRCANAETKLSEVSSNAGKVGQIERELREKNVLIGKLRHDAVVNNEHLTEALRRLRKNSSDNNVDRRLVTNILLSFLTTSRGDTKRFEMLSLLSTILSWDDNEREKAGLQRKGVNNLTVESKGRRASGKEKERTAEEEAAMNESFSNLFVEFLLKEASQGQTRSSVSSPSLQSNELPSTTTTNSNSPHPTLHANNRTFSQTSLNSPFSPSSQISSLPFSPPSITTSGNTTPFSRPRGLSNSSYSSERPGYFGTSGRKISGGLRDVLGNPQGQQGPNQH